MATRSKIGLVALITERSKLHGDTATRSTIGLVAFRFFVQSFKGHDRSKMSKIIVHGRRLVSAADFATRPRQHNNHLKHLKIANVVAAIAMVSFVLCDDWLEGTDAAAI